MKRRRWGQHFLNSSSIANIIVAEAEISRHDTVYEVGTGLGILTPLLCKKAGMVISIDTDRKLFERAKTNLGQIENLTLQRGNGFKTDNKFSIFVSNLPYSQSRLAVEWLARTTFSHGVIMVQKEFAQKLISKEKTGKRAIRIIANHALEMTQVASVGRKNFDPVPSVDSVLLKIRQKMTMEKPLIQAVNLIFSYKRKTIRGIFRQFGMETVGDGRLDDLSDEEVIGLAKEIIQK